MAGFSSVMPGAQSIKPPVQACFRAASVGHAIGSDWPSLECPRMFILTFRSDIAYERWWEGGTLLQKTRGEWWPP